MATVSYVFLCERKRGDLQYEWARFALARGVSPAPEIRVLHRGELTATFGAAAVRRPMGGGWLWIDANDGRLRSAADAFFMREARGLHAVCREQRDDGSLRVEWSSPGEPDQVPVVGGERV